MATAHFQVSLDIDTKEPGAGAKLVTPSALEGLDFDFVVVKEDGEEAIIKVSASGAELKSLAGQDGIKKLTAKQLDKLKSSYLPAKLKKMRKTSELADELGEENVSDNESFETFQTVRSGFYLIDVPVILG